MSNQWVPKSEDLLTLVVTQVASEENEMFGKIEAVRTRCTKQNCGVTVETVKQDDP